VTTGTVTSAGVMAERLPDGAIHQYIPLDARAFVTAFLDHWRPDLAVWCESEFWPR
jgi:3-deoxy-D-manno-octulosonic-acid transferase